MSTTPSTTLHHTPRSSPDDRHRPDLITGTDDAWNRLFSFENYGELLALVHNSLIAGAVLGLVGGLVGVFVISRDLAFAVHGISELSFAGAAAALLLSVDVVVGSMVGSILAAVLIGVLGSRARDRNSIIGVLMPFGLGLGVLFLDPDVAIARGIPVRSLSLVFMIVLGLAVALAVQLALGGSVPISPYVTTISFLIYLICRAAGSARLRARWTARAGGVPAASGT